MARRQVAIVHTTDDAATAQALCGALLREGYSSICCADIHGLHALLEESYLIVILISQKEKQSDLITNAADLAGTQRIPILPVLLVSHQMSDTLYVILGTHQWVDVSALNGRDAKINKMIEAIRRIQAPLAESATIPPTVALDLSRPATVGTISLQILVIVLSVVGSMLDQGSLIFTGPYTVALAVLFGIRRSRWRQESRFWWSVPISGLAAWIVGGWLESGFPLIGAMRPTTILYGALMMSSTVLGVRLIFRNGLEVAATELVQVDLRSEKVVNGLGSKLKRISKIGGLSAFLLLGLSREQVKQWILFTIRLSDAYVARGARWERDRRTSEALEEYRKGLDSASRARGLLVEGLRNRGLADFFLDRNQETSFRSVNRILKEVHLAQMRIYEKQGDFADALVECGAALRVSPLDASLYFARSRILVKLGRPRGAFACLQEAKRIDPSLPGLALLGGRIAALIPQSQGSAPEEGKCRGGHEGFEQNF